MLAIGDNTRVRFRQRRLWPGLGALLGSMLLSGCGLPGLARDAAPPRTYLLEWAATDAIPAVRPVAPALAVAPLHTAAGFDSTRMLYVEQPYRLDAYAQHRWADTPARMLEPLLVDALETSGLFAQVVAPGSRVRTGLRLDGEVLRLQRRFDAGSSAVELAMRFSLIDTTRSVLLATDVIRVREPAPQPDPYGGVLAANRAVNSLFAELRRFLARELATYPGADSIPPP